MPEPVVGSTTDQQLLDAVNKLHTLTEERWKQVDETVKQHGDKMAAIESELPKIKAVHEEVQALARARRHALPDDSPLSDEIGDKGAARGGWKGLSYEKALSLPSNHVILRPNDAADLKQLQEYHDACVIKFWMKMRRMGASMGPQAVWAEMLQDEEFKTYLELRERHGFGTSEKLCAEMAKGAIKTVHDFREDERKKTANMIGSTTLFPNLDFTLLSSQLIQKMRLDLVVAAAFKQVRLTRHSQKIPAQGTDAMGVWGGGTTIKIPPIDDLGTGTSPTNVYPPFSSPNFYSQMTFPSVQFDVEPLMTFIAWNDDLEEDSVIDWLPIVRDEAARGNARALDRAILDGDTTATHRDTDAAAAGTNDFRKALVGLRKLSANYDIDNEGGVFDIDDAHTLRASLGMYGKDSSFLYLLPLKIWFQLTGAASASAGSGSDLIRRVDTIGIDRATLRTGQLGELWGSPALISEFVRTDVDATGVNGASGNDFGLVLGVNASRFGVGMFNDMRLETERFMLIGTSVIMAKARVDFQPLDGTTITNNMFATGLTDIPCNVMFDNA